MLVCALLMVVLAGCATEDEEPQDPLFSVCPQWIEGPYPMEQAGRVDGSASMTLEPMRNGSLAAEHDGFALDLYVLNVITDAPVTVSAATTDGRNLLVRDTHAGEPDSRPALTVNGATEIAVYLTAVSHGTEPDPTGLVLRLEGDASVTVDARAWYRVCGAVVGAPAER